MANFTAGQAQSRRRPSAAERSGASPGTRRFAGRPRRSPQRRHPFARPAHAVVAMTMLERLGLRMQALTEEWIWLARPSKKPLRHASGYSVPHKTSFSPEASAKLGL